MTDSTEIQENRGDETPVPGPAGLFIRGLAMGAADVVPGVSGGTIAFITGIYQHFIAALTSLSLGFLVSLCRGDLAESWRQLREIHWGTLIPLGAGVAAAIIALSKIITSLMTDAPGPTYAFFFGLILASIYLPFARMNHRGVGPAVACVVAAGFAWLVVGLQPDGLQARISRTDAQPEAVFYAGKLRHPADLDTIKSMRDESAAGAAIAVFDPKGVLKKAGISLSETDSVFSEKDALYAWLKTTPSLVVLQEKRSPLWWIFICGLIAISAMVLPGLSGSFLLLFLGQYHAVFSGIHQCIGHALNFLGKTPNPMTALTSSIWLDDVLFVGLFGVGVLVGLATFSRVVKWLFENAHDLTLAALGGLMIGALRLPGEIIGVEVNGGFTSWTMVCVAGAVGTVIVGGLTWIDLKRTSASSA